jgi:hypothetical protein
MEPIKIIYGFHISPYASLSTSPTSGLCYFDEFNHIKHSMLSIELHQAKPSWNYKDKTEVNNTSVIKAKEEFVKYVYGSQPICIRGKRMY